MKRSRKKVVVAAGAALASLGMLRMASAQTYTTTLIDSSAPSATIDGWNITVGSNVALSVLWNSSTILIDKAASFQSTSQEIPITFAAASSSPLGTIDFTGEELTNQTGSTVTGFTFQLLPTGSGPVQFAQAFTPPDGGLETMVSPQQLDYTGLNVPNSTTLDLGSEDQSADNLIIDGSSDFTLKEIAEGGGGTSAVPLPAAALQSAFGLVGLGLFGVWARWNKRRLA
jgi:hypothetical protein